MNRRRLLILSMSCAMLGAALAAQALKPTRQLSQIMPIHLEQMIPRQFGDWRIDPGAQIVAPAPEVQANLDKIYDQTISRAYVNPRGERMMLTIAYGGKQTNDLKAHRQEVCYTAQGFKITQLFSDTLTLGQKTIPITRMLAVQPGRSEPVTYWFTMGDSVVLSRFQRLMVQFKYGLSGQIPDGMLVRVSNISTNAQDSYAAHVDFVRELMASMRKDDVSRLLGALGA